MCRLMAGMCSLSCMLRGCSLLGDQRLAVRVPADGDSEPVMFELRADAPGAAVDFCNGLARRQLPR